ncbi:MAG: mycothiol synthase [Acidimicrobiia bacterium]|nr:mycothiol synthase [Acidimicrobiia bacterium]
MSSVGIVLGGGGVTGASYEMAALMALELATGWDPARADVIAALIEQGVELAATSGGEAVRVWAFQPNMVDEFRKAGFRPERELRQLRIDLPIHAEAALPPGFHEDRFRPSSDSEAWLEVNNAAFDWHPENGSWTEEILADRMAQDWFDPNAFVVVRHDTGMAGFCWTKAHDDLGEIYVIAVAPGFQGCGLGRFLVVRGLEVIHGYLGFGLGMLYMDADNTTAARLYDDLGFRLHHVDRSLIRRR